MHINLLRRVLHEILLSQERSYKVTYDLQKMPVPSNSVGLYRREAEWTMGYHLHVPISSPSYMSRVTLL